ncbi:MAG: GNAT family N-acetyltransferase [Pseudomonadota bacterium]
MQIKTHRLSLRALQETDAAPISRLAGVYDVARMTGAIPHPLGEREAQDWVTRVIAGEEGIVFAIVHKGSLIGCSGYMPMDDDHAELGYWIGEPFWGQGFATEAVRAVAGHAFDTGPFGFLTAGHFADNPRSKSVLTKLGFMPCGDEMRDSAARGEAVHCFKYRLDRTVARDTLRAA